MGAGLARLVVLAVVLGWPPPVGAGDYKGTPTCDYCRMFMTEKAFGGRLITTDGKTLIFDATECMAAFTLYKFPADQIRSLRSVDWAAPEKLLDAKRAWYLRSAKRPSVMGVNLSAYASRAEAERARAALGDGQVLDWEQVLGLVRRRWLEGKPE
jgi:copper chaperone NosL